MYCARIPSSTAWFPRASICLAHRRTCRTRLSFSQPTPVRISTTVDSPRDYLYLKTYKGTRSCPDSWVSTNRIRGCSLLYFFYIYVFDGMDGNGQGG